jgi:hypothetical protein
MIFTFSLSDLLKQYRDGEFCNVRLCINIAKMAETDVLSYRLMDFVHISNQFHFQWASLVLNRTNEFSPDDYFMADNLGEFDIWNSKSNYSSKKLKISDWIEYRIAVMEKALLLTGDHVFHIAIRPQS